MGPPLPLVIMSGLLILGGAVLLARSAWRLAVVVRARFTFGAPYAAGQIGDRLFGLVLTLPLVPLGGVLLLLALAQPAFQPTSPGNVVRVGRIDARRAGWSRTAVRLDPDPGYPERRHLEGEIDGARWAVTGVFLDWAPGVRWLGLRPAHRVQALVGTTDPSGTSAGDERRTVIDAPPRAAAFLLGHAHWLPFLVVRRGASSWFTPADRAVVILYATPDGYMGDVAATAGAR
jgi:hypothetical protein